jgi:hypothetical protein
MGSENAFPSLSVLATNFWTGVSKLIAALLAFLIGWLVAKLVMYLVVKLFRAIKIDKFAQDSGLQEYLNRGNITKSVSELIGIAVYWLMMLVVILFAVNLAGLSVPSTVMDSVIGFIPKFILALVIFVFSLFLGKLFGGIVTTSAANAGIQGSSLLGRITQVTIVVFGIVIALQEINIASEFIASVFMIVFAAVCFGTALTFALGAKDLAKKYVEDLFQKKE